MNLTLFLLYKLGQSLKRYARKEGDWIEKIHEMADGSEEVGGKGLGAIYLLEQTKGSKVIQEVVQDVRLLKGRGHGLTWLFNFLSFFL